MSHNLRLAFIIIGLGVMAWFITPTVRWYFLTSEDKKEESNMSLDEMIAKGYTKEQIDSVQSLKRLRSESVNMGLDLQGGIRIVLQADFEEYAARLERNVSSLTAEEKNDAMDRLISRLRGRIDQFGVSEVGIRKQGEDRVVVELPGVRDPDRIKSVVLSQGALTFNLVDEEATAALTTNDMLMGVFTNTAKVPEYGKQLYFYSEKDDFGRRVRGAPVIVNKDPSLEGSSLINAQVGGGEFGEVTVEFELNSEGATQFAEVTAQNVNRMLAIVLDDKVISAPNINQEIRGGRGVITGRFTLEEAQDLARILKEGALPLNVSIVEEEVVGQSIGADSVKAGATALLMAAILVAVFMIALYRVSGVLATIAMLVNVVLIIAVLSPLRFTLTLPGIAGLILTIGMAVDANVIIFERIKDELKIKSNVADAIISGYDRAFATIFDSNITTIIVALILWIFGSGPVQGFAITLFFGILINLFTAVFITRYIYEEIIRTKIVKKAGFFFI